MGWWGVGGGGGWLYGITNLETGAHQTVLQIPVLVLGGRSQASITPSPASP